MDAVIVECARLGFAFAGRAILGIGDIVFLRRAVWQTGSTTVLNIAVADIFLCAGVHEQYSGNS
jgi:hypothetical protein